MTRFSEHRPLRDAGSDYYYPLQPLPLTTYDAKWPTDRQEQCYHRREVLQYILTIPALNPLNIGNHSTVTHVAHLQKLQKLILQHQQPHPGNTAQLVLGQSYVSNRISLKVVMGDSPKKKTISFDSIHCTAKSGSSCLVTPIQHMQQVHP